MFTPLRCVASSSKSLLSIPIRTPLARSISTKPTPTLKKYSQPRPPPLPPKEQAEFDALIKANSSIGTAPATEPTEHPNLRKGPKRDFEGDTNPLTGEKGGPRTDPFKAGLGDWQYGGRVTDF